MAPIVQNNPSPIDFEGEIAILKNDLNAVVISHYYQDSEVQDVSDFVGDSLENIQYVSESNADLIVFCGSRSVAESISILNPKKKVLVPDIEAEFPIDNAISIKELVKFRDTNTSHEIVSHINSSSEVKSISDIIVTTSNAEKIILSISKEKQILFASDKNLGSYLINKTGVPMVLIESSCLVHNNFSVRDLIGLKAAHPRAKIIAHPSCTNSILEYANHIGGSASLIKYVEERTTEEFIILTEPGIIHQMHKRAPKAKFFDVPLVNSENSIFSNESQSMRLNTLEKLYLTMKNQKPLIHIDPIVVQKARIPLE
ncbi:MAG: hypothetical protein RLZZ59_272, partial [Pseudomonadota bacterium]